VSLLDNLRKALAPDPAPAPQPPLNAQGQWNRRAAPAGQPVPDDEPSMALNGPRRGTVNRAIAGAGTKVDGFDKPPEPPPAAPGVKAGQSRAGIGLVEPPKDRNGKPQSRANFNGRINLDT
jgi:hypothetical protein